MSSFTPSTLLVEPNAPQWAQRLGLRPGEDVLQNLFPTQPTRLWDAGAAADLPPPENWPGTVRHWRTIRSGVSDGASWSWSAVAARRVLQTAGACRPPGL